MNRSKPINVLASALALTALLTACGEGNGPTSAPATKAPQTTTSPAPVAVKTTPAKPKDAATIATALKLGKVKVWTEENDPNKLLGRPGQYTSAASVVDKRTECPAGDSGISCGASVEVFASAEDAGTRAAYIEGVQKGGGLGTEYHTVVGAALLRVTGELTPKQAAVYAERFKLAAA